MAVAVSQDGRLTDPEPLVREWRDRIQQAKEHRRQFEPAWLENLDFAAGRHHRRFDRFSRSMVLPSDIERKLASHELLEIDVITERRMRALGELSADDDRPELLLVDEGDSEDDFAAQLNRAVGHGWDHEWDGDDTLLELRRKVIDLGTAAVRCRFDKTAGPMKNGGEPVPHHNGMPILDAEQARSLLAEGPNAQIEMRPIHEGRIVWEVLSPFNLLVPPGIDHEKDFPWEIVVRPVPLDKLVEEYGAAAADIKEDTDIGNLMGADVNSNGSRQGAQAQGAQGRLRGHAWLYTCYRRPTLKYPNGQVVVLASNQHKLIEVRDRLDYKGPDETPVAGVAYFHWWRVNGRFFSRALIEPMKDVQRRINKRTNQIDRTIDAGQAFVIVDKNGNASKRKGFPVELIELEPGERQPVVSSGVPPGQWMYEDKKDAIEDLDRASGIGQSALGENPENAQTYGQLALLHEQEAGKRSVIRKEHATGIAHLVEFSVYDIRAYWGDSKQILLDSDDDKVQARVFNATKTPTFFVVRVAKGASKPRSQGAEIQKIDAIWQAALASQVVASNPNAWIGWYYESLDAGEAQDLPEIPNDEHAEKAEFENHMMSLGQQVEAAYYDPPQIHVPIHRDAQVEADMAGDLRTVATIELHIQQHLQVAQQVAERNAGIEAQTAAAHMDVQQAMQPPAEPGAPGQQQQQGPPAAQGQ